MLLGLSGLAAEVTIGFAVLPILLPTDAASSPPPQPIGRSRYRNRLVEIRESGPLVMVSIDGRMVHIEGSKTSRYHSHILPFRDFDDLPVLVRTLIDMSCDHVVIL